MLQRLLRLPRIPVLWLIKLYQKTFSPDHGVFKVLFPYGYCKFKPSCSDYTYKSVEKYGVLIGLPKGIFRVARCNPCSKGGIDKP